MLSIHKTDSTHVIRVKKGEELVGKIHEYCEKHTISAAWVQGLGAGYHAEISFYDLTSKTYLKKIINEEFELLSLLGNIALVDHKPFLHAHVTLGKKDYGVVGGHLHSMIISGTGEICITKLPGEFSRSLNEETGLKLLDGEEL